MYSQTTLARYIGEKGKKAAIKEQQRILDDLMYNRNHPIYPNWNDWCKVLSIYNNPATTMITEALVQGQHKTLENGIYWTLPEGIQKLMMTIWQQKCIYVEGMVHYNEPFPSPKNIFIELNEFCYSCDKLELARTDCHAYPLHFNVQVIGWILAQIKMYRPSKTTRKYYKRLIRVLLSLPEDRLKSISEDVITHPQNYQHYRGKNKLMKHIYERGLADTYKENQIIFSLEYLKHFRAKQQGATPQSYSGLENTEFVELAQRYIGTQPIQKVLDRIFQVKQQGLFSFRHEHGISDRDLEKLKAIVDNQKTTFYQGFGDMIVKSGGRLMAMFAVSSTIGVILKVGTAVAMNSVVNILHLLYSLVFGSGHEEAIRRSAARQQSGEEFSIPFLPAMFLQNVLNVPTQIVKTIWKNPNIDQVMRRLGYLGDIKIERGIDRLVDWMIRIIRQTRTWFCRSILGVAVPEDIDEQSHPIVTWNKEVDDLIRSYYDDTIVWSDTTWSVVYNLYARGLTFTRSKAYAKWHREVYNVITKLGNILEKFKQHARDGQTIRNPPVTIYLAGGTGVGKSSITYPLAAEILKGIYEKEGNTLDLKSNWKNLIYMRSAEQEFWDGYENQLVTVFDDFSQQADSASNPNLELFEIIRASNCFPYPLHMASLDQKANTSFTSKIIIVSSNLEKPATQSLNFPEALYRRFDICIEVGRKPAYKTSQLKQFDPDIYKLTRYDMKTGKRLQGLTYEELVKTSVDEYFSRSAFVDSVTNYIEKRLDERDKPMPPTYPEVKEQGPSLKPYFAENLTEELEWDDGPSCSLTAEIERTHRGLELLEEPSIVPWMRTPTYYERSKDFVIGSCFSLWQGAKNKLMNPFEDLKRAHVNMTNRLPEFKTYWQEFKEKHPYIFASVATVAIMASALAFLRMFMHFYSYKDVLKQKGDGLVASLWRDKTPRSTKQEAYSPPKVSNAKVEAYSPPKVTSARVEAYTASKVPVAKVEAKEEGVKDLNATEILMSTVRRNLYKMYESTFNTPIGHCLFLKGKIALMCRHFTKGLKQSVRNDPEATVTFKSALLQRAFVMRIADLLATIQPYGSPDETDGPVTSKDVMTVTVDSAINHPNITSTFCTRGSLSQVLNTEMMLPVMVENNQKDSNTAIMLLRFRQGRSALSRRETLPVGDDEQEVCRIVRDVWRYEADTQPTECGSPLLVRNSKIGPGKICGIHIAGIEGTGEGFSTPIYLEDVEAMLAKYDGLQTIELKQEKQFGEFPTEQGQVPSKAEFVRIGSLQNSIYQPSRTNIEPSLCHGKIRKPTTKPCQLKPTKDFDPRAYRLERLGNVPLAIPRDLVQNSKDAFVDEVCTVLQASKEKVPDSVKAVYTFEEAIMGIDGDRFVNSIKRNTSPGYPYVQNPKTATRKQFFGVDNDYDLSTPAVQQLRDRCDHIISEAKRGVALDHYFIDTLKDERKPKHKAHKTRLFSAGPLDYLVVSKMYFNGPVALLQMSRNWSHVSVGTNPYSEDWSEVAKTLLRKSTKMVAGDFEGFDASQHLCLLEAAGEVFVEISRRCLGATEEQVLVMRTLLISLLNSFHITGKEVYQWTHSLPSGHYLTAPINSVFVNIAFGCIWQIALNKISYMTARSFWNECGIVAYGDDHILSIPSHRIERFNQFTIPEYFKEIGLSYTMEDKDCEVTRPYRDLTEVTYLKRGFSRDEEGQWLAPLSLDTILETPMWMHKCPDPRKQTIENLEWALKELSLHDEDTWLRWAPVLRVQAELLDHYTIYVDQISTREACRAQLLEM